jgi:hypothetical protein
MNEKRQVTISRRRPQRSELLLPLLPGQPEISRVGDGATGISGEITVVEVPSMAAPFVFVWAHFTNTGQCCAQWQLCICGQRMMTQNTRDRREKALGHRRCLSKKGRAGHPKS